MNNIIDILLNVSEAPLMQTPSGTLGFFKWYFYGLGGLGGWLIFLLLALIALVWVLYDSSERKLPATGWRIAVIVLALLLLPTIIYRFSVKELDYELYNLLESYRVQGLCPMDLITNRYPSITFTTCDELLRSISPMTPYGEFVFYLGLLGGILAPILAIGYFVTYQGLVGCYQGHVYEADLGECPECNRMRRPDFQPPIVIPQYPQEPRGRDPGVMPPPRKYRPSKPKINDAWLIDLTNNRRYDLFEGTTRIGRSEQFSDIVIKDPSISRKGHAAITESHRHFTLKDIGSSTGTYLNDRRMRKPQVLQNGDLIALGDTVLKFVSA